MGEPDEGLLQNGDNRQRFVCHICLDTYNRPNSLRRDSDILPVYGFIPLPAVENFRPSSELFYHCLVTGVYMRADYLVQAQMDRQSIHKAFDKHIF